MSKQKYIVSIVLITCLFAIVWAWMIAISHPNHNEPATPASVVLHTPYDPTVTPRTIEFLAKKTRDDPQSAISYNMLAGAYMQRCRETGDIAYAIRAGESAGRSLAIRHRRNAGAYDELAKSLLALHQFRQASNAAEEALKLSPDDLNAAYLIVEADVEEGEYAAANRRLSAIHGNMETCYSAALRGRIFEIDGKTELALQCMQDAEQQADRSMDLPSTSVAWFHMRVGDRLAATGRDAEAEAAYREAIVLFPGDYKTLTSLCRLAACRGDWQQAIKWGKKAAEIVPAPDTLALLGDAYHASGQQKEAEQTFKLIDAIASISRAQGAIYDRQRSLYYADHDVNLTESLSLALAEMKIRHDVFAYDTLAWAYYKNHKLIEANAAIQRAMERNTQDASLYYHAGMIAFALNDRLKAKMLLEHALAINPRFHPFAPATARATLTQLGNRI